MMPGSFKISSMSLGFDNGLGHSWAVWFARNVLGFKWVMLQPKLQTLVPSSKTECTQAQSQR